MKKCKKCGMEQERSRFHRNKRMADGLHIWCKSCVRRYQCIYRARKANEDRLIAVFGQNNAERLRVSAQNSRTKAKGLSASLTFSQWIEILERYKWSCAYCGGAFECMDHIIPIAKNGGTTKDNVLPSCKDCNRKKNAYEIPQSAWVDGYVSGYKQALEDHGIESEFSAPTETPFDITPLL